MNFTSIKTNIFLFRALLSVTIVFLVFTCLNSCSNPKIKLNPDDTATFAVPEAEFDKFHPGYGEGQTDSVQYYSSTVGSYRKLLVYTPPHYSINKSYPVLYLLHGIEGNQKEWYKSSSPQIILDNLISEKKIQPLIAVFPNGRAMKNDELTGDAFAPERVKAFENFEKDLMTDVISFIEKNYSVKKGSEYRAIAGFSIGGGQALNFGLNHLDTFAWIGGFSPAATRPASKLIPDMPKMKKKLRLLYVSCGNQDRLLFVSQEIHQYLKLNHISHIYQVNPGDHSIVVWLKDLYYFVQLLFK